MFYYQYTIVVINILFPLLAVLAVLARLSARRITKLPLRVDDWLIVAALVLNVANAIYTVVVVYTLGYGAVPIPQFQTYKYKFIYTDIILINAAIGLTKCSVVCFYKRIFTTRNFSIVANIVLFLCAGWTISVTILSIFPANPVSRFWDDQGHADYDFAKEQVSLNVLDLALDLLVLSLPLPMIRSLHINRKKRLAVTAIFGVGIFCVIATSVRIYYFLQLAPVTNSTTLRISSPEQATVISDTATLWIHIECSASIITACLPILVPVVTKLRAFTSTLANSFSRLTQSKTSAASRSDDSLDLKSLKLSSSREKNSTHELGQRDANGQIKATTVISVI